MRGNGGPGRRVRRTAAIGLMAGALVVGVGTPAHALEASSYGVDVNVTLLGGVGLVDAGPLVPSAVGDSPNSLASVAVPPVLTTGVVTTTATGDPVTGGFDSSATVADPAVNVAGVITLTAGVIGSTCTAAQAGNTGDTELTGLAASIAGIPVVIPASPAPNTVVNLNIGLIQIAQLRLNEQIVNGDGGLTVNAVHLVLLGGVLGSVGSGNIVISSSTCGPAELPVPLAHGSGLILGIGIVGLAGGTWYAVRRRRPARALAS